MENKLTKISIIDFIPPILLELFKKIKRLITKDTNLQPFFVHPMIKSFSQYNEDLIIDSILACKKQGYYVDVGANHPRILNNTERFYLRGWNGINIEPNPDLFKIFESMRKRDINLNIGIGKEKSELTFYILSADIYSTFNKDAAKKNLKRYGAKIIGMQQVKVEPLADIFDVYLQGNTIDFMSVDVEGYELEVLQGNNWLKFRPYILLVEINQNGEDIKNYLDEKEYEFVFCNGTNGIFIDKNSIEK